MGLRPVPGSAFRGLANWVTWGPIQLLNRNLQLTFQLSFAIIVGHPVETQLRIRLTFELSN